MTPLPKIQAMDLRQQHAPFDQDEWLFELKHDGFRALAYIENGLCRLVDRNGVAYTRFRDLARVLPSGIDAKDTILDGELVVLDRDGRSKFNRLVSGRGAVLFAAFDLMWLNGRDLRDQPLWQRKEFLRPLLEPSSRLHFVDHIEGKGTRLYAQACHRGMEGIVCKAMIGPYRKARGKASWIKVDNPTYSQNAGRLPLFSNRRG